MRTLLRVLGGCLAVFFILVTATATVKFIGRAWFAHKSKGGSAVAVLDVSGMIVSSANFTRELNQLLEDTSNKVIVVRVNSPGGLVAPSQEMYQALRTADQKVPVVISMGSLAASGGYYLALGGRKIYANPGTLTASIGVIMEFLNTQKVYEWVKVEPYNIKSGKFKDIGSTSRPMRAEEKELLTNLVMDIYHQFRNTVKERRKLSEEELDQVADGRILSGFQAKQQKLVDELKGFEEVVLEAKKLANLPPEAPVHYPESNKGLLQKVLFGDASEGEALNRFISLLSELPSSPVPPGWRLLLLSPAR